MRSTQEKRPFRKIAVAISKKGGKKIAGEVIESVTKAENKIHVSKVVQKRTGLNPLVKPINDRMPRNAAYAGKMFDMSKLSPELQRKYPHGVPFTAAGHPDFSRYSIRKVEIKMTGDNMIDRRLADRAAGFTGSNKRPAGYTWHHHEDCKNMLLVPKDINDTVKHTGGAAIVRASKK